MSSSVTQPDAFEVLSQHASELSNAMDAIASVASEGFETFSQKEIVLRLWNQAIDKGELDQERKETLLTQLAWANKTASTQERLEANVRALSKRLSQSNVSVKFGSEESELEFLERLLAGMASNLINTASPEVEASGEGRLRISWNDGHSNQPGRISWSAGDESDYAFIPIAAAVASFVGDLNEHNANEVAQFLADDLRAGRLAIPPLQFDADTSNEHMTVLTWKLHVPAPLRIPTKPSSEELERVRTLPIEPELVLWRDYPKLADALDNAICYAINSDEIALMTRKDKSTVHGTERLVDLIRSMTNRDETEVRVFLTLVGAAPEPVSNPIKLPAKVFA